MQTYIVRIFEAIDLETFTGLVEEPITGLRVAFADADTLMSVLCRREHRTDEPIGLDESPGPEDAVRSEVRSPRRRS